MSRKHLGMKRPIKQFDKAVDEMIEYINAFNFLPPRGEGAKELAIQEWKACINNVVIQLNNIKNTQIELLMREEKMINADILLENEYKEFEVNKMFHPYANRMFQKRFRNNKGQTRYFITFYEYLHDEGNNYEVSLQFEKDKYVMNIQLFAISEDMTLEQLEWEVYGIWYGLDCKYYDSEVENDKS